MTEDLYLMSVLAMHRVEEGPESTPERVRRRLMPAITRWGGQWLEGVMVSGSYAKGTAIRGVTLAPRDVDVDLFLSMKPGAGEPLADYQSGLARELRDYSPTMGNVSVKVLLDNVRVDLTVGRRAPGSDDHFLWQRRRETWIRTNVKEQIRYVRGSGRLNAIRLLKIWRRRQGLYFPSFCLELAVVEALAGVEGTDSSVHSLRSGQSSLSPGLAEQFVRALDWIAYRLPAAVLRDPANGSNIVSEVMTVEEKGRVAQEAGMAVHRRGAEIW